MNKTEGFRRRNGKAVHGAGTGRDPYVKTSGWREKATEGGICGWEYEGFDVLRTVVEGVVTQTTLNDEHE